MENHPEVARILKLLESLLSLRKVKIVTLSRHLGMSASNLHRIFDGRVELKYAVVLDVLAYLEIPPLAFFKIAYEQQDATTDLLAARLEGLRRVDDLKVERLSKGELKTLVLETLGELGLSNPRKDLAPPAETSDSSAGQPKRRRRRPPRKTNGGE